MAWSFYPTKNFGALGEGGAISTDSEELITKALCLRNYGQSVRYSHPVLGMNSRLDEIQAAILRVKLKYLSEWVDSRRKIANAYNVGIRHHLIYLMPLPDDMAIHSHHLFVIICEKQDALLAHLRNIGIETLIHYPIPVHHQAACVDVSRDLAGLLCAESHADNCLSIPCHPYLKLDEVKRNY